MPSSLMLLDVIFSRLCFVTAIYGRRRHPWSTKLVHPPRIHSLILWKFGILKLSIQMSSDDCCGSTNSIVMCLLYANAHTKSIEPKYCSLIRGRGNFFASSTNVLIEYYRRANNKKKQQDFCVCCVFPHSCCWFASFHFSYPVLSHRAYQLCYFSPDDDKRTHKKIYTSNAYNV